MRPALLAAVLLLGCGSAPLPLPGPDDNAPDAGPGTGSEPGDAGSAADGSTMAEAGQPDAAPEAAEEAGADAGPDAARWPVVCQTPDGLFTGCNGAVGPYLITWGSGSCDSQMPGAGGYCPPGTGCEVHLDDGGIIHGKCDVPGTRCTNRCALDADAGDGGITTSDNCCTTIGADCTACVLGSGCGFHGTCEAP